MPDHQPVLSRRQAQRGQALVLASVSLLLLALMMALSFNLSHALRGKTRLQQHSDALAYSMATIEARSFNYFAVSNRAIAASYVAMNSMHASMAAASVTVDMLRAGSSNFNTIAGLEALMCSHNSHCGHAIEARRISSKFSQKASEQARKVRDLDDKFTKTVRALDGMMNDLHASQHSVYTQTSEVLSSGSAHELAQLQKINAPEANALNEQVGQLNADEFACAIDGMPCRVPGRPEDTPIRVRAREMDIISNASRTDGIAGRDGAAIPSYFHPRFLSEVTHEIQGVGISLITNHKGTAKTVERRGDGPLDEGANLDNSGLVSSAHEHGTLFSFGRHGLFASHKYKAFIASDKDGGEHTTGHSGSHDQFKGIETQEMMACANQGNCFMKFRADSNPAKEFGQPPVYSYVTQQLRDSDKRRAPWQLNDSARFKLSFGPDTEATLDLAAGEGAGLSKALVYYHRLGAWQEPPNLFNPFWRAKLHPFSPAEAALVLDKAGNPDAARLAATERLAL